MSNTWAHARNLAANWMGYSAYMAVTFFLTPFIVHSLGNARYGVWSLIMTLTSYLGLIEIGVQVGTGRFINYYLGRGDMEKVTGITTTSLVFYGAISGVVLIVAAFVGIWFGDVFTAVPSQLADQAKWVVLLAAVSVPLGFFSTTFDQLLHARDRFDLRNAADILVLTARTGGVVWALTSSGGLLALAAVQVGGSLLGCALKYALARWKGPPVRLHWQTATIRIFREIIGFGVWAFISGVGYRVIYYSSAAVIGVLLGVEEITAYSIGFMLVDAGRAFAGALPVQILKPTTERAAGRNASADLRWLLVRGSRMEMLFGIPLLVGFIALGKPFISLWMGPGYEQSATILAILAVAQFGGLSSDMSRLVLQAVGKVRLMALFTLAEATANLAMSIVLVAWAGLGIMGVAIGVLIPMLLNGGIIFPWMACRATAMPIREYLLSVTSRWMVTALVLGVLSWQVAAWGETGTWTAFGTKAAVILALYAPLGGFLLLGSAAPGRLPLSRRLACLYREVSNHFSRG